MDLFQVYRNKAVNEPEQALAGEFVIVKPNFAF